MLAQGVRDDVAGCRQLGLEDLPDQRHARTALGAGPGAGLQRAEFGAGVTRIFCVRVVAAHGLPHRADRDHVAGADQGVVGQFVAGRSLGTGRREVRGRLMVQLPAHHRAERGVGAGVADEDAAEQGLGVVGQDELLVQPAGRVGVDDFERARRGREGVAETGHLDAGELEFGGIVDGRELRRAAEQPVGDHLGHGIGRSHEADASVIPAGDLADRPDIRIARAAVVADRDAAAGADSQSGGTRQFVPRRDADRVHDQVGRNFPAVAELQADHRGVVVRGQYGAGPGAEVQFDALGDDEPAEGLTAALVELGRHEPVAGVHNGRVGAERMQSAGRFEAEQSAAGHHDPWGAAKRGREGGEFIDEGVDVVEGAIHPNVFPARHLRHGGARPGGEHEVVILEHGTGRCRDGASDRVDPGGSLVDAQRDPLAVPRGCGLEGKVDHSGEPLAQCDPVVGAVILLGQHDDRQGVFGVPGVQGIGEPVRGGAATDHDDAARWLRSVHGGIRWARRCDGVCRIPCGTR